MAEKITAKDQLTDQRKLLCGIVMPISPIDGYPAQHWSDVLSIINQAVIAADFHPALVSHRASSGVIQKSIVENLYNNPIVVCDLSAKNPNVLFELGLRLAFDKPTILIKDALTDFNFDTGIIQTLIYPTDLRFADIVSFKEALTEKIIQTHEEAINDKNYSTFLKNFGTFKVAKIETEEVSKIDFLLDEMRNLKELVSPPIKSGWGYSTESEIGKDIYIVSISEDTNKIRFVIRVQSKEKAEAFTEFIDRLKISGIIYVALRSLPLENLFILTLTLKENSDTNLVVQKIKTYITSFSKS